MLMEKAARILIISSDKKLREVLNFCFIGWGYEVYLQDFSPHDTNSIKKISPHVIVIDVHSASRHQLEICNSLKDDFTTKFIPIITMINKRQLRSQLLNLKYGVDDYLIKPPDPLDLRIRVEMALRRAHYIFYSSSLTGFPGGRIIDEVLRERLKKSDPFSFGYLDLDNFKYFNDAYGYLKGDRIIMQCAHILYTVVKKFGNKDDFVGHIGGDDFVFITTPDRYEDICQNFIVMFDKIVPFHYSDDDRKQGFIIAKDRNNKIRKVSFVSASIAVVTRISAEEFTSNIEINERVTEIKHYLKDMPGSKFMADRRTKDKSRVSEIPRLYRRDEKLMSSYRPLGQILLENNTISAEQLDEALRMHWEKGIILGETLLGLGFLKEEELKAALNSQRAFGAGFISESKN